MSIFSFIKSHAVLAGTVAVVAVAGGVIAGRVSSREAAVVAADTNTKHVSLVEADSFRTDSDIVSVDGVVQSVSQVDLKSQISGPITSVMVSLGDTVRAGQTLVELSNADIRAQLEQAKLSVSAEGISLDSARKSALDAITDSFLKADEAIHTQIDPLLLNNTGTTIQLSNFDTDPVHYQQSIVAARSDLTNVFASWNANIQNLGSSPTDPKLTEALHLAEKNVQLVQNLLDQIVRILNNAATIISPSDAATIGTWKATVTGARASITGVSSSLIAADKAFSTTLVTQGGVGASPSTVAQSTVKNLEAQLAKTIITSPISGRVAALPLRSGEFAAPGTLIATVVGPEGLQVDAFASAEDIARISRGSVVSIGGIATGTVSLISPSVNPLNKKVEVKILVQNSDKSALVIGQTVNAHITATPLTQGDSSATGRATYRLPIQNVKIVPGHAYVFTVDADSKLVRHEVTLGTVTGDFVEITSGMTPGMKIVSPVYELEDGQTVITD
ncbi:MAG TPA: HlyD family efflux transporter periplasmic adaptor subunit [Candidatus Paceibacterota bacterium]